MKQNPLKLPLIGGGIAFLCFFLPWIKFDFSSLDITRLLPDSQDPTLMSSDSPSTGAIHGIRFVINGATFEVLTFLATLVILGVCLYMFKQQTPWKARIPVLICSSCGVIYYLISLIQTNIQINSNASKVMEIAQTQVNIGNVISLQFGIYGVLIGFVVALIGAWKIPKSDVSIPENE